MTTITISGTPGSGKSTVCEILKEKTGLPYIYSGMIFRNLAKKHKMTLAEFGKYCEDNHEVDAELDEKQLEILQNGNIILEGRLAGWLAFRNKINALKVMLDTDMQTRAERVVKREEGNTEERKKEIIEREKSECARYKKYYDIDLKDTSIYDLVLDTKKLTPDEIVDTILEKI